jgi:hypothetical protein
MNKHTKPSTLTPNEIEMAHRAKAAFYSKRGTQQSTRCTCIEAIEEIVFLRGSDFVARLEMADPRDRWKHTGELPSSFIAEPPLKNEYRTPQATLDAFFGWIVRQDEATQAHWLAEHPKDAPLIRKLWREKCSSQPQSK